MKGRLALRPAPAGQLRERGPVACGLGAAIADRMAGVGRGALFDNQSARSWRVCGAGEPCLR
eukprot:3259794-Prymnesium_polylepis.1